MFIDVITTAAKVDGRTLRHQHRRPELLTAAAEYILEHGVADLSLRPMAAELGVSHSTLIRHFGTKEALVIEVIDEIRSRLFGRPAEQIARGSLEQMLRAVWRHLCEPTERRQFVFLFEVVALHARDPDRFGPLAPMLITDFLTPLQVSLRTFGLSAREARDIATGFLAQVRGLQLDLAVSGDQRRVDAAMNRYIDTITRTDG